VGGGCWRCSQRRHGQRLLLLLLLLEHWRCTHVRLHRCGCCCCWWRWCRCRWCRRCRRCWRLWRRLVLARQHSPDRTRAAAGAGGCAQHLQEHVGLFRVQACHNLRAHKMMRGWGAVGLGGGCGERRRGSGGMADGQAPPEMAASAMRAHAACTKGRCAHGRRHRHAYSRGSAACAGWAGACARHGGAPQPGHRSPAHLQRPGRHMLVQSQAHNVYDLVQVLHLALLALQRRGSWCGCGGRCCLTASPAAPARCPAPPWLRQQCACCSAPPVAQPPPPPTVMACASSSASENRPGAKPDFCWTCGQAGGAAHRRPCGGRAGVHPQTHPQTRTHVLARCCLSATLAGTQAAPCGCTCR